MQLSYIYMPSKTWSPHMLKFDNSWRYNSPGPIPPAVSSDFYEIISKVAQGKQEILEHFETYFASAAGATTSWSSSASWAETDLNRYMDQAADNAPMFIQAFHDACEDLNKKSGDDFAPNANLINSILAKHNANYHIDLPNLIAEAHNISITPPELPQSLDKRAQDTIQKSFSDSQRLFAEGNHRQAVQEILWLLETVSTVFPRISMGTDGSIEGKYFNKILKALKNNSKGTSLEQVINWITTLHGYLSAPAGGGIRHGMDLKDGVATTPAEAKLYCNLITSYISFLLSEYERLHRKDDDGWSNY